MVEILNNIIERKANMVLVPKYEPTIIGYGEKPRIVYDNIVIPFSLHNEFLNKCGVESLILDNEYSRDNLSKRIAQANNKKDIYLRYADERPLSVVTGKFMEIKPSELLTEVSDILHSNPTIRYFKNNESLQMNFPIDNRFKGLHINVNTGNYGIYGGSGKQAVDYSISWYNKTCSNWTIFLRNSLKEFMQESQGRIIHINNDKPKETIRELVYAVNMIEDAVESSRDKLFNFNQLNEYFSMYESKGMTKQIAETIKNENPKNTSAYDLSYRLTELCQNPKLSDITRGKIEYMAGEVILSYKDIITATEFRLNNPQLYSRKILN